MAGLLRSMSGALAVAGLSFGARFAVKQMILPSGPPLTFPSVQPGTNFPGMVPFDTSALLGPKPGGSWPGLAPGEGGPAAIVQPWAVMADPGEGFGPAVRALTSPTPPARRSPGPGLSSSTTALRRSAAAYRGASSRPGSTRRPAATSSPSRLNNTVRPADPPRR